ncbi:hemerythrin domain-containing protein [Marinospirillum perlucidum]|uniref:hemerythrin domain-containing protein n=1 Tax=Marinospirillum perlucidum TaxID=1982602 RepID=UPI000DF3A03B|nr:hemerythrin domain-containing protein [Marinospirillum perlucidum]
MTSQNFLESAAKKTSAQLIDHLLDQYHARHREHLPQVAELARQVEASHAEHPEVPNGLTQLLLSMLQELDSHMQKEEMILFPMLRQGRFAQATGPIHVMQLEHREHDASLQRLQATAKNLQLPADACATWTQLYQEVDTFMRELQEHIALENEVLFAARTRDAGQEVVE